MRITIETTDQIGQPRISTRALALQQPWLLRMEERRVNELPF